MSILSSANTRDYRIIEKPKQLPAAAFSVPFCRPKLRLLFSWDEKGLWILEFLTLETSIDMRNIKHLTEQEITFTKW
jgi:hypothetical protein